MGLKTACQAQGRRFKLRAVKRNRMPGLAILVTLVLAVTCATGCSFTLHLFGADMVNPVDPKAQDPGRASQELAVRVYQLKDDEKIQSVMQNNLEFSWEAFRGSGAPPAKLRDFLAKPWDPAQPDRRPVEDFYIERAKQIPVELKLESGTRWLFVVSRGHDKGAFWKTLVYVGPLGKSAALCFDRYDVYQEDSQWFGRCQRSGQKE